MIKSNVNKEVLEYLSDCLHNLYIEILNEDNKNILDLMKTNKLEGWCWETTESIILFLKGNDYIERGNLHLENETNYYHSWICFKYNNEEYILDACLNILCKKNEFMKEYNPIVIGRVTAKEVKEEFIKQISIRKKEKALKKDSPINKFFESTYKDEYSKYKERKKDEVIIYSTEEVNSPFYRNGCGYTTEIINGKIKKALVHFYLKA